MAVVYKIALAIVLLLAAAVIVGKVFLWLLGKIGGHE